MNEEKQKLIIARKNANLPLFPEQHQEIIQACRRGDVEHVKSMIKSEEVGSNIFYYSMDALNEACRRGHLEMVKYLLCSDDISRVMLFNHDKINEAFRHACGSKNLKVVEFLNHHHDWKNSINIVKYKKGSSMSWAFNSATPEIIDYLINSKDLKNPYKVKSKENLSHLLKFAFEGANFEVIEHIFNDKVLNAYVDIEVEKQNLFKALLDKSQYNKTYLKKIEQMIVKEGFKVNPELETNIESITDKETIEYIKEIYHQLQYKESLEKELELHEGKKNKAKI